MSASRPRGHVRMALGAVLVAAAAASVARPSSGDTPTPLALASTALAKHVQASIVGLDFEDARRDLRMAERFGDEPPLALERARLAIYELDCDGAAAILARPEVVALDDGQDLADIAHGCQRVTASLASSKDEARGIEVRWQDENDAALAPLLFDTVALARESLTRDLGVDWPRPTRIVVVRDLLSLSAMTGLPYDSARTTGTVAVAKWGRVTLLSPRASPHGFPWRDTVAHELTHLAVTRATGDRAPLWLQEGVAKRGEVRWRPAGPFDDRPPVDAVVQHGIERGLAIPLDKLGPSIAMLPTADAAMVAFAEVTSFVRFYLERQGDGALPKLLAAMKDARDPNAAVVAASGVDLKIWDARWRAFVAARPREPLAGWLEPGAGDSAAAKDAAHAGARGDRRQGGVGGGAPDVGLREIRERSRLAELLLSRQHPAEALEELSHITPSAVGDGATGATSTSSAGSSSGATGTTSASGTSGTTGASGTTGTTGTTVHGANVAADPSLAWLKGRALELVGRAAEIGPLVSDPHRVAASFGRWWALRARWLTAQGDDGAAHESFSEALAADPLDPQVVCTAGDLSLPFASLCDAARAPATPGAGEGQRVQEGQVRQEAQEEQQRQGDAGARAGASVEGASIGADPDFE